MNSYLSRRNYSEFQSFVPQNKKPIDKSIAHLFQPISIDDSSHKLITMNKAVQFQIENYKSLIKDKINNPAKNFKEEFIKNKETIATLKLDLDILNSAYDKSPLIDQNMRLQNEIISYKAQNQKLSQQINQFPVFQNTQNTNQFEKIEQINKESDFLEQKLVKLQNQLKKVKHKHEESQMNFLKQESTFKILGKEKEEIYHLLQVQEQYLLSQLQDSQLKLENSTDSYQQVFARYRSLCYNYDNKSYQIRQELIHYKNHVQRIKTVNSKHTDYKINVKNQKLLEKLKNNPTPSRYDTQSQGLLKSNYNILSNQRIPTINDILVNSSLKNFSQLVKVQMNEVIYNNINRPFGHPIIKGVSNKVHANIYLSQLYDNILPEFMNNNSVIYDDDPQTTIDKQFNNDNTALMNNLTVNNNHSQDGILLDQQPNTDDQNTLNDILATEYLNKIYDLIMQDGIYKMISITKNCSLRLNSRMKHQIQKIQIVFDSLLYSYQNYEQNFQKIILYFINQ